MSVIKEVVRNILLYYILVSVTMSLIGNSGFKKYVEMFTGLVLILIIITPILKYLKIENKLEFNLAKNQLYEITEQESQNIMVAELSQGDMITEEYKESIQSQIQEDLKSFSLYPESIHVEVEESLESNDFGQIKSLEAICTKGKEEADADDSQAIETIEVPKVYIEDEKTATKKVETSLTAQKVKSELAEKYDISADQINILVEEE